MSKGQENSAGERSIKDAANRMDDTQKLPVNSKMEKAVEQAKATSGKYEQREIEQQRDTAGHS